MIRFFRFNAVGTIGVAVQLTVLWMLTSGVHMDVLGATAIAVAVTILHNFCWHVRWTWADRQSRSRRALDRLVRFAAANGLVSMVGNVALMGLLVSILHLAAIPANLVAIAACGVANYWLADRVVFRPSGLL